MTSTRIPKQLYTFAEVEKYFSLNFMTIRNIWCKTKEVDVKSDEGKLYHARYVSATRSRAEHIEITRAK